MRRVALEGRIEPADCIVVTAVEQAVRAEFLEGENGSRLEFQGAFVRRVRLVEFLLFVERRAKVDPCQPEIRRQVDGPAKERLGIVVEFLAGAVHAHQAQRVEVFRVAPQEAPQDLFRFRRLAAAIQFHGFDNRSAVGVALQRVPERFVRLAVAPGQGEHFNELAVGRIRCGVVADRGPERCGRLVEPALLNERIGEVLVSQGEVGQEPDYPGQRRLRLGVLVPLRQGYAEQPQQVRVVGRVPQRGFQHRTGGGEVVRFHQAHRPIECEPGRRRSRFQ